MNFKDFGGFTLVIWFLTTPRSSHDSESTEMRQAAEVCARTAVFRPALIDQKPVEVWGVIPVTFKLRG